MDEKLTCLEESPDCTGPVQLHTTPNREDLKAFPRCDAHWGARMDRYENSMEKYVSWPRPPAWFDPSYAGESWDEDY